MEVLRYWIGASPEEPAAQVQDLAKLHKVFSAFGTSAAVEQYGSVGSMILLKVESEDQLILDFVMPNTVVAFEYRHLNMA